MTQHSKAPWVTVRNGGVNQLIESANGNVVVYTIGSTAMRDPKREANARRIVAAVNACEGIATDVLEKGRLSGDAFQLEESRADKAEQQRDDLLSALEIAETYVQTAFSRAQARDREGRKLPENHPISRDLSTILAAIAKVKGVV